MANTALDGDLTRMTADAFETWDDGTATRYQLIDGVPMAMTPPARWHGAMVIQVATALRSGLPASCRVVAEAPIRIPDRDDAYYAADIAVACGPQPPDRPHLADPQLIVEVLSPSTRSFDLGDKALDYRSIPSLGDILLVSPTTVEVLHYRRSSPDIWTVTDIRSRAAVVQLDGLGIELPLADIYAGLDMAEPAESEGPAA